MLVIWMAWLGCPASVDDPVTSGTTADTTDSATTVPCVPKAVGEICTESGPVLGVQQGAHWRYQGIPYAAPPVGALRWQPPEAPEPWTEPRASALGPICPQWDVTGSEPALVGSEDCLSLNVYRPDGADGAPVLVFLHGGGHQQGDSAKDLGAGEILYDGAVFAESHGAVVVTLNYRLGPFGFFAHPDLLAEGSANHGMLDQIAALGWVQRNIAAFGGDPDRVMVFGESAGAVSVCRLLVAPAAEGLFHAAAMESGACTAMTAVRAHEIARDIAEQVDCTTDVPACLRSRSVADLMSTFPPEIQLSEVAGQVFTGVVDGEVLPDMPRVLLERGQGHDVPVLLGSNADETGNSVGLIPNEKAYETAVRAWAAASGAPNLATLLLAAYPVTDYDSQRDAFVALTSDAKFTCNNRRDARILRDSFTSPVFRYHFDQVPENASVLTRLQGAYHGLELFYVFDRVGVFFEPGKSDLATQQAMTSAWAGLAASGSAGWVEYGAKEELTLISGGATTGPDPRAEPCDFWDGLLSP